MINRSILWLPVSTFKQIQSIIPHRYSASECPHKSRSSHSSPINIVAPSVPTQSDPVTHPPSIVWLPVSTLKQIQLLTPHRYCGSQCPNSSRSSHSSPINIDAPSVHIQADPVTHPNQYFGSQCPHSRKSRLSFLINIVAPSVQIQGDPISHPLSILWLPLPSLLIDIGKFRGKLL
jgi:hypothetical protein